MLRATTIGLAVLAATWVAIAIVLWQAVALAAGWDTAERLVPYVNAHLFEQASLRLYQPWVDPVYWLGVIANGVVPIAIATVVSGKLDPRAPFAVAITGVVALALVQRDAFTSGVPAAIRAGSAIEICVAGIVCLALAALMKVRAGRSDAV